MVVQCLILFAFLALGELVVYLTGVPIPSSIIGMISLTAALKIGIIKEQWVSRIADFLVKNIGFFFVPAGVGLLKCLDIIRTDLFTIIIATIVSTLLVIAVTGRVHQFARKLNKRGISRK